MHSLCRNVPSPKIPNKTLIPNCNFPSWFNASLGFWNIIIMWINPQDYGIALKRDGRYTIEKLDIQPIPEQSAELWILF